MINSLSFVSGLCNCMTYINVVYMFTFITNDITLMIRVSTSCDKSGINQKV